MLINLSNHPSTEWRKKQIEEANNIYGRITDVKFPDISPEADFIEVKEKAKGYLIEVKNLLMAHEKENNAIHIMGEFTFTFNLVELLKQNNILAVSSTTSRQVYEDENGNKISKFNFIKFRNYY